MWRVMAVACLLLGGCGESGETVVPVDRAAAPASTAPGAPADATPADPVPATEAAQPTAVTQAPATPRDDRVVHVIVALADNQHQGIVRVPADLGNGQSVRTNLYWGAMYGVKTFTQRQPRWQRLSASSRAAKYPILETCVWVDTTATPRRYMVAQAYDGRAMKQALVDFFAIASGDRPLGEGNVAGKPLACGSEADLVCFVGHNGLMEVSLDAEPVPSGKAHPAAAVVLACKSKPFFADRLTQLGCTPLVMTTGLMAPEAYSLDAIVAAWSAGGDANAARRAAAKAYDRYQKCSITAARRLFDAN